MNALKRRLFRLEAAVGKEEPVLTDLDLLTGIELLLGHLPSEASAACADLDGQEAREREFRSRPDIVAACGRTTSGTRPSMQQKASGRPRRLGRSQ